MKPSSIEGTLSTADKPKKFSLISSGNYPYVCARVRARRALLLSRDVYSKLLMMDVHQITRFLGESQYKKEITELGIKYAGLELTEIALNRNMSEVYHQILGYCDGDLYTMLSAYLQREDVWNIKTILRGKFYNATPEEIMKTIRAAGRYPEDYWKKIVQTSKTVGEVIDTLEGNEYYQTLKVLGEECSTNLTECEDRLEIAYYDFLLGAIPPNSEPNKLFLSFVRKEIDLLNLKTLLMTKFENVEPDKINKMLVAGGEISEKEMQTLTKASNFKQLLEELQKLPYYEMIRDDIKTIEETGSLSNVIRILEKDFLTKATKSSYLYPLSILPILDYLIRKKIEIENLRILARGKDRGLSEQALKGLLVM
jgi:V/A-type H+/Na+-transporting ATPase subunit C